jgi:glycosyltransferase involved in cell wall biosynthesis
MPVYKPKFDLLKAQIDSIKEQTHKYWQCLIICDGDPEAGEQLKSLIQNDQRFRIKIEQENQGIWKSIETLLNLSKLENIDFVSLADQDDVWNSNKITEQLNAIAISGKKVTSCDAILMDVEGKILKNGLRGRERISTYLSLLLANEVSGASMLMSKDFLDAALPFPPISLRKHHDHYLALLAFRLDQLHLSNFKLYNWVQHGQNLSGNRGQRRIRRLKTNLARLKFANASKCVKEMMEYHHFIAERIEENKITSLRRQVFQDFPIIFRKFYIHEDLLIGALQIIIVKLKSKLPSIVSQ